MEDLGEYYRRTSDWQQYMWEKLANVILSSDVDRDNKRRMLDIGCGTGQRTAQSLDVFRNVESVLAIDANDSMIHTARNRHADRRIEYVCADVNDASVLGNVATDIVIAHWTLHWVENKTGLLTHIAEHGADDVHLCISTCEALPQFFITLDKEFRRLLGTTSKSPFKYLTFREWSTLIGASGFEIIRHERLTLPHLIVASEEFLRHWEAASTKAAYYGRSWDALEPEVRDDLMTMLRERFGTNGTSFWRFDEETLFFIASRRD